MNKASGGDGIPVELFQILKDDAVKVLHSICQQIWKTQEWPQDWKKSVFIPIPKKSNAIQCSNYHTVAFISHVSKVILKVLQPGFNSTWTENFQMFKLDLGKAEEPLNWTDLKTCLTRFPGAQSASLHPELPQGLLKFNSYSSMGFNLPRGRWQMPLLFSPWQCSC